MSVVELHALMPTSQAPVLVDVREPDEWMAVRVPGVRLIPLAEVPLRLDELPPTGPVYLICATGNRSDRAAQFLRARGFDAVNVAGGTMGWMDAGFEVESGPAGV